MSIHTEIIHAIEPLTLGRATELFLQTVNHSQSNVRLLLDIFMYIHTIHPEWQIDEKFERQLVRAVRPRVVQLLYPDEYKAGEHNIFRRVNTAIFGETRLDELTEVVLIKGSVGKMRDQLNWQTHVRPPRNEIDLISLITSEIVAQDFEYLRRPKQSRILDMGSFRQRNPVSSYLCYYGLEGHTTGTPELDRIYADVRDNFPDALPYINTVELQTVVAVHTQERPESSLVDSFDNLFSQ